ncbi:MAG: hypothetical protein JWR58_2242 [Pseudonocardia sp.]|nr:hypothetical protein [Pseudonocardia sp.]
MINRGRRARTTDGHRGRRSARRSREASIRRASAQPGCRPARFRRVSATSSGWHGRRIRRIGDGCAVEVPEAEGSRGSLSQALRRDTGHGARRSRRAHGNGNGDDDGGEAAALLSRAECRLADRDECEDETDSVHRNQIFETRRFPALHGRYRLSPISAQKRRSLLVAMAWLRDSHVSAKTVKNEQPGGRSSWGGSIPSTGPRRAERSSVPPGPRQRLIRLTSRGERQPPRARSES